MIKKRKTIVISLLLIVGIALLVGCKTDNSSIQVVANKDITYNDEFLSGLEKAKNEIISTKPLDLSAMDNIDHFVDKYKDRDEVKNDLCNFIIEKWNTYLQSGKEDKNVEDRLSIALSRIYIDYPSNIEIQKLEHDYSYKSALKEVSKTTVVSKNLTSSDGNLELLDYKSENGDIVGTIKNNSSSSYGYVEININLLDNNGNQVGSTISNVENLQANGNWKFRAVVIEKNVSKFTVVSIKGNK